MNLMAIIYRGIVRIIIGAVVLTCLSSRAASTPPPFRLGLNFAFPNETNLGVGTILTNFSLLGARGARHVNPSDLNWSAILSSSNALPNFTVSDPVFFNPNNLTPIATLYEDPNATNGPGLQVPWLQGAGGFSFTSNELWFSSNYVRAVVLHNTNATHLWEIANEVSGITNRPWSLPPDAFASYLATNYAWIHALDPQAQVLLPGCLGGYGLPVTNGPTWLRQVLTNLALLGKPGFDVMNYHDYKSWWALPPQYDAYRAALADFNLTNLPVWITESASSTTNNNTSPPYAGEDQQAADTWRRSCLLFGKGASVFIWHSLYSSTISGFAYQGLCNPVVGSTPGTKKKAWHSFRLLCQKVENFQTATLLSVGNATTNNSNGGQGQWAVQFDWADGTRRYVAWSGTNLNYTLTNLTTNAYRLTTVVPATISTNGEDVTFTVTTNTPVAGSLTLTLATNFPVLIESTVPAAPVITNAAYSGGTFTLGGTGPIAENYRLLAATNVALPVASWTTLQSGTFNTNGTFRLSDTQATNYPGRTYRVSIP